MDLYPLKLSRFLSPRLWGGGELASFLGVAWDGPEPLGESWQVYAGNRVLNGPLAGVTLAEVAERLGEALVGTVARARYGVSFPLLAKFIDAGDRLSIQVHPDDAYAHAREAESGFHGKEEAWLILRAEPGAQIIWGFSEPLTPGQIRRAALTGRLEHYLNHVPVAPGDVVYNPAGTLHAIGAGILLFEIQQSSDLTYRLYDYDRRDAQGKPRELHLDKALDVLDYSPGERAKVAPRTLAGGRTLLVETGHFAMERWPVASSLEETTRPKSVELLTLIDGAVTLAAGETSLALEQGESCVLPAGLGAYRLEGEGTLLRCYLPG
ncbi:MAG: class I mannose-6-phosphate isomerase [Deinococcota bacterium]|nr:class I mannose-6-phosphate isomerase [Deinococcota bacterium]